jgi:ribose transport system permease protein
MQNWTARLRALQPSRLTSLSTQGGLFVILVALWLVFGSIADGFRGSFNEFTLGRDIAIFSVIGLAQMVVLATGGMNLAVGAIGGISAITAGWLMQSVGFSTIPAIVVGLIVGTFLGGFNGWLVVRTGMSSFIVTLAMASVDTGALTIITQSQSYDSLNNDFLTFGQSSVLNISPLVFIMLAITVALFFLFRNTELGRWLLAVGANPRAAELSGVPVKRTILIAHALSGLLAATAGIMLAARLSSAVQSIGSDWTLPSFLAPVLGGTILSGGVVSPFGTLLGGVLVQSITNGLQLLQVNSFWVQLFEGVVLLLAVSVDRLRAVVSERQAVLR